MRNVMYIIAPFLLILLIILLALGLIVVRIEAAEVPEIIINEIMYNPPGADSGHQWIEIINVSTSTEYIIDESWRFNDGSNHQLIIIQGDEIISPNEYLVITENDEVFLDDYPDYQGSLIDTVMSLNNSEDSLSLSVDSGQTFFATTTYQSAWGGGDNGYSLERIDFLNNWQQSFIFGGTPGQDNSQAPSNTAPIVEIIGNATGTINQLLDFTASSTDPEGDELNYFWDFGDQVTSSEQAVTHSYNQTGQYQVLVIVSDGQLSATGTLDIAIEEPEEDEEPQEEEEEVNEAEHYSSQIIINEILANPVGSDNDDEWIELYNRGASSVNLANWKLSDKTDRKYTIRADDYATTTINAFSYFVVYRKESGIALNNDGDAVELYQPNDNLLDNIEYIQSAQENWSYAKSGGSWFWTVESTPGLQNIIKADDEEECQCNCPVEQENKETKNQENKKEEVIYNPEDYQGLRINEFMANPAGPDSSEWIEIYNSSSSILNLAGFQLDDEEGGSRPYKFTASSTITAFGYLLINREESKIALNNNQDTVRLINPDDEVFLAVNYEKAKEDWSYDFLDVDEEWYWSLNPTPGQKNIIIEEIPEEGQLEIAAELSTEVLVMDGMEFPFYSITEIKKLEKGIKVQTVGMVIVPPVILGKSVIYIAEVDSMANQVIPLSGIQLYSSSGEFPELKVGEVIEVTGKTSEVQGEKRINLIKDSQINTIKQLSVNKPELTAIDDITDEFIGSLIFISGELVEQKGSNYYIDDGTGEIRVYLKKTAPIEKPEIEEGYYIDVAGILTLTTSGYRLLPRFQEDIDVGQILGVSEEAELSDEVVVLEADDQKRRMMKYLLFGGGGVIVILMSLIIRNKYFKISNN